MSFKKNRVGPFLGTFYILLNRGPALLWAYGDAKSFSVRSRPNRRDSEGDRQGDRHHNFCRRKCAKDSGEWMTALTAWLLGERRVSSFFAPMTYPFLPSSAHLHPLAKRKTNSLGIFP